MQRPKPSARLRFNFQPCLGESYKHQIEIIMLVRFSKPIGCGFTSTKANVIGVILTCPVKTPQKKGLSIF